MKSERRAELKTNDLSIYVDQMVHYVQNNTNKVILFAVLLVALVGALLFRSYTSEKWRLQGWQAYYGSMQALAAQQDDPQWGDKALAQLQLVASEYPSLPVAPRARLLNGALALQLANESDEVTLKKKYLDQARQSFLAILNVPGAALPFRAAALSSLVSVEQSAFVLDGDPAHSATAKGYLEQIKNGKEFTGTPYQTVALARLDEFERLWQKIDFPPPAPTTQTAESQPDTQPMGATSQPAVDAEEAISDSDQPDNGDESSPAEDLEP
ncbi:MAG: hypothetical protein HJJLKODD_01019 [Phycisphaerae bacterium]|nr:hypothetical protein [Phycisphaerae bacterium]